MSVAVPRAWLAYVPPSFHLEALRLAHEAVASGIPMRSIVVAVTEDGVVLRSREDLAIELERDALRGLAKLCRLHPLGLEDLLVFVNTEAESGFIALDASAPTLGATGLGVVLAAQADEHRPGKLTLERTSR